MPRFTTLYSGSSGNSSVIEADGSFLLVDMGGSCKATLAALEAVGLSPEGLRGILVTHEHIDHIRGLAVFLKRHPVPVLATAATLDALWHAAAVPECADLVEVEGRALRLGGFAVSAFPTSHDAAGSCGFRVIAPCGTAMAIATDLGKMTADIFAQFESAALVALESNYDREMLRTGRYPAALKSRIASARGHLSNNDAAATVAQLVHTGCRRFSLCHLSEENNLPDKVLDAMHAALLDTGLRLPPDCVLQVARRHQPSPWIEY